jgi:hypothetical protein
LISEVGEGWEKDPAHWWGRKAEVFLAWDEEKEMEWQWSKLGHPAKGICERLWGKIRHGNFMKAKIYEVLGGEPREWGKGKPSWVKSTKVVAPQKFAEGFQLYLILGPKNKLPQYWKGLRDRGKFFLERPRDCEVDGTNTIRLLECGHDVVLILERRGREGGKSSVVHDERQGWPTI